MNDRLYTQQAITISQESVDAGGYPCGAIIVKDDKVIAAGISNGKQSFDPTMHAEIDVIRKAADHLQTRDLEGVTLYSSMEPCVMCFSACFLAYISRVVYACSRDQVDKECYMGEHNIKELNSKNYRRKIELIHLEECSRDALKIIHDWEKKMG